MSVPDRSPPELDGGNAFQFSLSGMFGATTLVAMVIGLVFVAPDWVAGSVILILTVSIPAALTIILIYGHSFQRTFCIGALFPTGVLFVSFSMLLGIMLIDGPSRGNLIELTEAVGKGWRIYFALAWCLAILLGISSVALRLRIERKNEA